MKILLFILSFFTILGLSAQEKNLHLKMYKNGDTALWYKWHVNLCPTIDLEIIHKTHHNWYFRLCSDEQAIDVWEDSAGYKHGKLTSWTKEHTPNNEEPTNRIYYEIKKLDSTKVIQLIALIDSSKIKDIPDEDLIENWGLGFDGITYTIETANKSDYYFKTYWTPTAQGNLREALIVQQFVDRCFQIVESKKVWTDFISRIPFEGYTNGFWIALKPLSKKERKQYKKERDLYRQQQSNIE